MFFCFLFLRGGGGGGLLGRGGDKGLLINYLFSVFIKVNCLPLALLKFSFFIC